MTKNYNFLINKLNELGYKHIKSMIYPPYFPIIVYNCGLLMFTRLPIKHQKYHDYNYLPIYEKFFFTRGF